MEVGKVGRLVGLAVVGVIEGLVVEGAPEGLAVVGVIEGLVVVGAPEGLAVVGALEGPVVVVNWLAVGRLTIPMMHALLSCPPYAPRQQAS